MSDHVTLPDVEDAPTYEKIALPEPSGESVLPATGTIDGGRITYLIKITMGSSNLSALTLLTHAEQFKQEIMDAMIAEATKVVMETRVVRRRKAFATGDRITKETDPTKIKADLIKKNEEWFKADVALFEAILCDKYGFLVLRANTALANIEPTAKLQG